MFCTLVCKFIRGVVVAASMHLVVCLPTLQVNAVRTAEHNNEFRATSALKERQTITATYNAQIIICELV